MKELKSFRAESMKGWLFLMTAALIITACSSNDDIAVDDEPQPADTPPTYTVSIDATRTPDADLTRALTLEGNTLNASWEATDVVAVMKNTQITLPGNQTTEVWKIVGYLKPANISSDGLSCTLSGSITGSIATGDKLQLVYPGQESVKVEDGDVESQSQDFSIVYLNQDGTLEKIAKEYDYCRTPQWGNIVKVTAVEGTSITTSAADFTSNQAIVKFTLTDKDTGNPINAKELIIRATNKFEADKLTYFEQLTVPDPMAGSGILRICPNGGSNVVYAALSGINDCKVSLTATDYINTYEYEKSGVTFTKGKYYAINVKMTKKPTPPVAVEPSPSTPYSVGQYIGSDGKFYKANATLPEGVTKMALVAYVGNESDCAHGLAIALSDEITGTTSWGAAVQRAAEHTPTVLNATWRLPTMTDLQRMFIASGSNGSYKDDLHMLNKQIFDSSGFVAMLQTAGASVATGADDRYWSASHTSYSAWSYSFNTTRFYSSVQNMSYRVRAVLAF